MAFHYVVESSIYWGWGNICGIATAYFCDYRKTSLVLKESHNAQFSIHFIKFHSDLHSAGNDIGFSFYKESKQQTIVLLIQNANSPYSARNKCLPVA